MKKKIIFVLVGVVIFGLAITGLVVWQIKKQPESQSVQTSTLQSDQPTQNQGQNQSGDKNQSENGRQSRNEQGLKACPKDISEPFFTVMPMEPNDFHAFRPLGFTSPPIHVFPAKHSNFAISKPGEEYYKRPVKFPGDVTVTSVNSLELIGQNKTGYQIYFQPCEEFKAYFYHLSSVTELLMNELRKDTNPTCRQYPVGKGIDGKLCQYRTNFKVSAGNLAGYSGDAAGVDFGAVDYRIDPLSFANLADYTEELLHYTSPVLYFAPEVRVQLEKKIGSYDGEVKRTIAPKTGLIAQDIKGTAQGNWFPPGQNWSQIPFPDPAPFVALIHEYVNPREPLFSIGNSIKGVSPGLYTFDIQSGGKVNRDFGDVKADGTIYCYDSFKSGQTTGHLPLGKIDGTLLVSLPNEKTLKVEKSGSAGTTCVSSEPWIMTDQATTFER